MIHLQIALQILEMEMVTVTTKMMDLLAHLVQMVMMALMLMVYQKVQHQAMNNKMKIQREILLKYPIRMMIMTDRV
jgi:hypothetical protein